MFYQNFQIILLKWKAFSKNEWHKTDTSGETYLDIYNNMSYLNLVCILSQSDAIAQ